MRLIDKLAAGVRGRTPAGASETASVPDRPWARGYNAAATKDDILACFRLLLGRNPNAEEWTGHTMHEGEPLPTVVASYLNSLEFSRRNLNRQIAGEIVLTDLPGFKIYSDLNDGAVGKYVREGNYESNVTAVFHRLLKPGMGVLDIGANIGYFSMLSAAAVGATGSVVAIEPNQENARLLAASRLANRFQQITVFPVAAGQQSGCLALHTSHSTGTTSALPAEITAVLATRIVPCVALDTMIPPAQKIDLIKIDVDGAEYPAMRGCEGLIGRHRPAIISEFAPSLMPGTSGVSGEDYLRWFGAQGYEISIIEPDGALTFAGQGWNKVIEAHKTCGFDHIDILATPIGLGNPYAD